MLSRKMFRVAKALVFGSLTLINSPILYFAHILSLSVSGIEKWRKTTTAVRSASVSFRALLRRIQEVEGERDAEALVGAGGVEHLTMFALDLAQPFIPKCGRG